MHGCPINILLIMLIMVPSCSINGSREIDNLKLSLADANAKADGLLNGFFISLKSEGQSLNNCNVTNTEGENIELKYILGKGSHLVLRYSELDCNVCVDSLINKMRDFFSGPIQTKVKVLAHYSNPRELAIFKRLHDLKFDVYNYQNGSLNLYAENSNTPFLFISDSNLVARSVFIPSKEKPGLTNEYFLSVKRKLILLLD